MTRSPTAYSISNLTAYQPQAEDMSIEADVYQFGLLRQKPPAERFAIGAHLIRWSRQISLRGIQKARGDQSAGFFARSVLEEKWTISIDFLRRGRTLLVDFPGRSHSCKTSVGRTIASQFKVNL